MKKSIYLLSIIIFLSGCIAEPPPNISFITCQLSSDRILVDQTSIISISIRNNDPKVYENFTLTFGKSPRLQILEGNTELSSKSIELQPSRIYSFSFDVKGALESSISEAKYPIVITAYVNSKALQVCQLNLFVNSKSPSLLGGNR